MFIDDARRVQWRAPSSSTSVALVAALAAVLLVGMQVVASRAGFQGPLHTLLSDYVATPTSATVPWAGLGLAMVGLTNRWRVTALLVAVALDVVFAAERLVRGAALTVGNGPMIVLTGLGLLVWWRWAGERRAVALRGIGCGLLLVVAIKVGEAWLRVTTIIRPTVWDEYAMVADHALAQPSWLMGRLFEAAGPVLSGVSHWVYIELPLAAMAVAVYQLRNVTTAGWPRHFLVRTFLVLGLIGPVLYVVFPVIGPMYVFGPDGHGLQLGDYWPHVMPPTGLTPETVWFDDSPARNCMPSMHTAWALAVFLHSRRGPRWLRWGGAFWLAGTLAATLGFGYHYGVDLVAGAVLCLTIEAALREPVPGRGSSRIGLVAGGAAYFAVLLLCFRYLPMEMARFPLVFGPLMIVLLVVFSITFYRTFFAPGEPAAPARVMSSSTSTGA